jgi:predicted lipoprotein with Yx(FWY)xxD motif
MGTEMKKKLWVAAVVVAVVLVAAGAYAAMNRTGSSPAAVGTASNAPSTAAQQPPSSSNKPAIVQTKTDPSQGTYLADASGHPLYTYGGDVRGASNCTGQCISDWPAYTAAATTSLPTNVSVITRRDGAKQYAYEGLALYTFLGDSGSTPTGDDVSNFHLARP